MKKAFAVLTALLFLFSAVSIAAAADGGQSSPTPVDLAPKGEYVCGNTPLNGFSPDGKVRLTRLGTVDIAAWCFGAPNYLPATLPSGLSAYYTDTTPCTLTMTPDDFQSHEDWEWPDKYAIEFVSGEPSFKNIFQVVEKNVDGRIKKRLITDFRPLHETAGEATFRFTLENGGYFLQEERTLRVISWDEDPLFYSVNDPLVIPMHKGDIFFLDPNDWYENDSDNILLYAASLFMYSGKNIRPTRLDYNRFINIHGEQHPFSWLGGIEQSADGQWIFRFAENGTYDITMPVTYGDLCFCMALRFCVADEFISGPEYVIPGGEVDFSVEGSGLTYTWSLDGEGASIDPQTGRLTVDAQAPVGHRMMIVAVPNEGGLTLSMSVTILNFGF